jgi:site-specific recombinase XerC
MTTLAPALQAFFTERLISQRDASPNTIAGYRQTFRMLLPFASARLGKAPSQLSINDLDAPMVSAFLAHLENDRGCSPATRNNRLAAIHSMFAYVALHYPEHAAGAHVHTIGKGRKERRTPLVPAVKKVLKAWLASHPGTPGDPLFPGTTGRRLSRDAIERRLARAVTTAATTCPSLARKHVTMHTLRHSAAMRLLEAGNDITVIALWLGHEQTSTTNIYLHADMTIKQKAIDKARPPAAKPGRYQPTDTLLAFLESL